MCNKILNRDDIKVFSVNDQNSLSAFFKALQIGDRKEQRNIVNYVNKEGKITKGGYSLILEY